MAPPPRFFRNSRLLASFELLVELGAIGQPGQNVVACEMNDLGLLRAAAR